EQGFFEIILPSKGEFQLKFQSIEVESHIIKLKIEDETLLNVGVVDLKPNAYKLRETVITATRSQKSYYESPISVNVLTSKSFEQTQSKTVSEGLNFQPGLRIETDCQTCNYTQLRM